MHQNIIAAMKRTNDKGVFNTKIKDFFKPTHVVPLLNHIINESGVMFKIIDSVGKWAHRPLLSQKKSW